MDNNFNYEFNKEYNQSLWLFKDKNIGLEVRTVKLLIKGSEYYIIIIKW